MSTGPLWFRLWHFCQKLPPNSYTISDYRYLISIGNGMLCCKERDPLLLECFVAFLRCLEMVIGCSESIYQLIMVYIVSFLSKIAFKFHVKCQNTDTLSA